MLVSQSPGRERGQGSVADLEQQQAEDEDLQMAIARGVAHAVTLPRIVAVSRGARFGVVDVFASNHRQRERRRSAECRRQQEGRLSRSELPEHPHESRGRRISE